MTEDTVIGVAIEPRKPAREFNAARMCKYRDLPDSHWHAVARRSFIRTALERGPFLAAFDAGIDEVQV